MLTTLLIVLLLLALTGGPSVTAATAQRACRPRA